jgi:hypothetical protein
MSNPRAVRYRRLALQEPDKEKAQLLQLLADEADRGVLRAVEWTRHGSKIEIPIKSSEAKARTPRARSLGAPAPSGIRSSAIASQDHQRSVVRRGITRPRWADVPSSRLT